MSIFSYRQNVARGVTGPYKPTCLPSALEQISPHALKPRRYKEYMEFNDWYCSFPVSERRKDLNDEYADMFDALFADLGSLTCADVIFRRANTAIGLKRIVRPLLDEGYQVAVDVNWNRRSFISHTIGLVPIDEEHFIAVSNQVPKNVQGVLTLDDIAKRLAVTSDKPSTVYPFHNANIMALPPLD